jgi:hypothetical protein
MMSDMPIATPPVVDATEAATGASPVAEAVVEKPFNLDLLQSCTARMTHQCWQTYLSLKGDLAAMQTRPIRASLTTRSEKGMEEVIAILGDQGVTVRTLKSPVNAEFTATFAQIQYVIKHPQTHTLDAVKI